jgi:riboflavin biosynthesis pyrimidine reductase
MTGVVTAPALPRLPTRAEPRGEEPMSTHLEALPPAAAARGGLPPELRQRYDGDLWIPLRPDRPTLIANFASTLDGAVAMDATGRTGGGDISGFSPVDRFVMGLLRALSDVVVIGGSAARRSRRIARTADAIAPDAAQAFSDLRASLGLPAAPTTLIVTASGDLDPELAAFADTTAPVVIAAPDAAAARLARRRFGPHVSIQPLATSGPGTVAAAVDAMSALGARVVVSEAGPRVFADLLASGHVDELFLTLAPQLAGRAPGTSRPGLVEGAALWPSMPAWARLASARRGGDHLYLRYQLEAQA